MTIIKPTPRQAIRKRTDFITSKDCLFPKKEPMIARVKTPIMNIISKICALRYYLLLGVSSIKGFSSFTDLKAFGRSTIRKIIIENKKIIRL